MPFTMDEQRSKIIREHPIGIGLVQVRNAFKLLSLRRDPDSPQALERLDNKDLNIVAEEFIEQAKKLPAAKLLPTATGGSGYIHDDLLKIKGFTEDDLIMAKPLLRAAISTHQDDDTIWELTYRVLANLRMSPEPSSPAERTERKASIHNFLTRRASTG